MGAAFAHHALLLAGAGASTTYLDNLATTPQAVYSLRKLVSTATRSIRVRRSSDNAEVDIGFAGNAYDIAAVAAHVGAGNGFISKWYDQVGTNDWLQATAGNQPKIATAGVVSGVGVWDGVDDFMKAASFPFGGAQLGCYLKAALKVPGSSGVAFEAGAGGPASVAQSFAIIGAPSAPELVLISSNAAGAQRRNDFNGVNGVFNQYTILFDRSTTGTNEIQVWKNSVAQTFSSISTTDQTGVYSANDLWVGARSGPTAAYPLEMEALALYAADTSSIRTSIEALVA